MPKIVKIQLIVHFISAITVALFLVLIFSHNSTAYQEKEPRFYITQSDGNIGKNSYTSFKLLNHNAIFVQDKEASINPIFSANKGDLPLANINPTETEKNTSSTETVIGELNEKETEEPIQEIVEIEEPVQESQEEVKPTVGVTFLRDNISDDSYTNEYNVFSWQYNDGGRAEAGYTGIANDCVPRAIAIAESMDYEQVYNELVDATEDYKQNQEPNYDGVCCEDGTSRNVYTRYLEDKKGWEYYATETMRVTDPTLYHGTVMIIIDNHLFTMVDGIAYDTGDITSEVNEDRFNDEYIITGYFRKT